MSQEQAELDYEQQVQRDLPRNFAVHLGHGLLGQTGFRLINAPTFVPAYILLLSGGSDFAVGLALALQAAGSAITPLLGSSLIGHRARVLPIGFWTGGAMRVSVLGLALGGLLLAPGPALYAAVLCLALFGLFAGMQAVVFQVLLAKVIPVNNRGKLMGLRNFLAGITTAVVAWFGGHYLVGAPPSPAGYAWVFLLAFVLTSCGLLLLALVREPQPPTLPPRQSLGQQLFELPAFLRAQPQFTRYIAARALMTMGRMALPFYVLFAGREMGLTGATLATLTVAFTIAATVSNLFWGTLADRFGFRLCCLLATGLWAASTLALMAYQSHWWVVLVFTGIGAAQEGFRLASMSLAMEFGSRERIALRLAVANSTAEIAGAIAPLLGGILATFYGYELVFLGACGFLLAGGGLLLGVREPRYEDPATQ